jgi:hypothetical protein
MSCVTYSTMTGRTMFNGMRHYCGKAPHIPAPITF